MSKRSFKRMTRQRPKMSRRLIACAMFIGFVIVMVLYKLSTSGIISTRNPLLFTLTKSIDMNKTCSNEKNMNSFNIIAYTWVCQVNKCSRIKPNDGDVLISQQTCAMMCGVPPIWPKPKKLIISNKDSSIISPNSIEFSMSIDGELIKEMITNATDIFINNLKSLFTPDNIPEGKNAFVKDLKLHVTVIKNISKLKLNTNEGYNLKIKKHKDTNVVSTNAVSTNIVVEIEAETYFGARHALETLSQLIWYDNTLQKFKIFHDIEIDDSPTFPYRGVMIDTARNYFPIKQLEKVVDGMAASKLNVLHLHLTDSSSFPIILPNLNQLAEYGAYSSDMVYKPEDIKDLIRYARLRGVRVLLEIDAPSHVNAGWKYFKDLHGGNLIICGDNDFFSGHLNPDNVRALEVLTRIYEDLLDLSDDNEIFHIGGDEVDLNCWSQTNAAKGYTKIENLWLDYTNEMIKRLKIANGNKLPEKIIVWSSTLTDSVNLEELNGNIVIQYWLGSLSSIRDNDNQIIYSTVGKWYLDCGFGPWNPNMKLGVCDPYTPWQTFYKHRPWKDHETTKRTLGGEVCLWSEQVGIDTIETRLWPRTAAFAERVWTDPDSYIDKDIYTRLDIHKDRLLNRGFKSETIWPRWCSQNRGKCGFH